MKRFIKLITNVIELYIPIILLCVLFASFIIGIFTRYVLRAPASWTYELSTIAFVSLVMLSACYVQRRDEHIEFDLVYEKQSPKTRCLMRIISNLIITLVSGLLVPASIEFVESMKGLSSPIMRVPRGSIFICFIVAFIIMFIRSAYYAVLDIKSFISGDYTKKYPVKSGGI